MKTKPPASKAYWEKLKDPRWLAKRIEILKRDDMTCQECNDKTKPLHIHHRNYEKGHEPWDYPNEMLLTLCEDCHEEVSERTLQINRVLGTLDLNGLTNVLDFIRTTISVKCSSIQEGVACVIAFMKERSSIRGGIAQKMENCEKLAGSIAKHFFYAAKGINESHPRPAPSIPPRPKMPMEEKDAPQPLSSEEVKDGFNALRIMMGRKPL